MANRTNCDRFLTEQAPEVGFRLPSNGAAGHDGLLHVRAFARGIGIDRDNGQRRTAAERCIRGVGPDGESPQAPRREKESDHTPFARDNEALPEIGRTDAYVGLEGAGQAPRRTGDARRPRMKVHAATHPSAAMKQRVEHDLAAGDRQTHHRRPVVAQTAAHTRPFRALSIAVGLPCCLVQMYRAFLSC
jgi:hypothetical protein